MRATESQVSALAELHERMLVLRRSLDFGGYFKLNTAFHDAVFAAAGNDRLTALNASVNNELLLFNQRNMERAAFLETSTLEHAKILAALKERAAERLARAFESHVLGGRQRMLAMLPTSAGRD